MTPTIMVRPRGWHLDERHLTPGRPAAARCVRRLRPVLLPQRADVDHQRRGTLLLPAQAGILLRGPALERGLQLRPGTAGDPVRHDPGHVPDRDHTGGLRDGGDPLRAARPFLGAECRPLGLHLLDDQELRRGRGIHLLPDRSPGDDDLALHGRVRRTCWSKPATPGAPTPSAAWPRSCPAGTIPKRQRQLSRRRRPTSRGRPEPGSTDPGWHTRRWSKPAGTAFTEVLGDRPNQLDKQRDDVDRRRRGPDRRQHDVRDPLTVDGVRTNIRVSLEYLLAWVGGAGAVAIDNLMEDAATGGVLGDAGLAVRPAPGDCGRRNGDHRRPRAPDDAGGGGKARPRTPTSASTDSSTRRRTSSKRPAWSPTGRSSSPTTPTTLYLVG